MATEHTPPPIIMVCRHCFSTAQLTSVKTHPTLPGKNVVHYNCSCGMVVTRLYPRKYPRNRGEPE